MALSTYLNWDTLQIPNSELSSPPNHFFPYSEESFYHSNTLFDNYFDPTFDFLYPSEIYLPHYTSYDPFISLTHDTFLTEDYNLLPCPKRQKCNYEEQEGHYSSLLEFTPSNFLEGFAMINSNNNNSCSFQAEELPFPEVPEFKVPQNATNCSVDFECEKKSNERTISAQSIAARERRRKITEKTQELGKLVPGGPKMNTAEMLHAASKYVKYLQAQVGMLQLTNTLKEDTQAGPQTENENLHGLVVSPFVQEKLYSEERCFVPKEFVTTLTNHEDVQSRPSILKDLKDLIGIDIEKKAKQD